MEKIFICQQCHAELGEDEVDGILGHAVPDYDEDGDVDGCNQCGPCEMNRDWALARIKSLKDCAAKMQKRILELAENEAVTSANYNGAVARIADLEQQLAAAQERNTAEKKRREYYQHIVYSVCNMLDQIDGRHHCIVCGTAEEPCNNVEAKIQQLTTELDSLRQQLAAAQERNAKLEAQLTTANSKIEWLECRA